jgi:molybdopterin synthase sulfur carrier subunit
MIRSCSRRICGRWRAWRRGELEVEGPVTQRSVLDALEARYPMLRGTIRDHVTQQRRPFVRFFACRDDQLSFEPGASGD